VLNVLQRLESRIMRIEDELKERPKSAAAASAREAPFENATLSGAIQGQMLSDILQLISSNQMSGVFVIDNELGRCTLTFDEGRICHAVNGDVSGEDAFFAAFASREGRYHFKEMSNLPPERTVSAGTQYLVLEALRRMDESEGEGSGNGGGNGGD
jgi:hypothetical protein